MLKDQGNVTIFELLNLDDMIQSARCERQRGKLGIATASAER